MPNLLSQDEVVVADIKVLTGGQVQKTITFPVLRTTTTATAIGTIPAGATIFGVSVAYGAVSNAATTATVNIGTTTGATEILSGFDVKGNAAGQYVPTVAQGLSATAAIYTVGTTPLTIYAKYAETGTASTSGGPFIVAIEFATPTS